MMLAERSCCKVRNILFISKIKIKMLCLFIFSADFPEYFVEKIDTKKQMLKEQRRELLKKVIEEMLIQNVKNKV